MLLPLMLVMLQEPQGEPPPLELLLQPPIVYALPMSLPIPLLLRQHWSLMPLVFCRQLHSCWRQSQRSPRHFP
jgi:hypothetical protein